MQTTLDDWLFEAPRLALHHVEKNLSSDSDISFRAFRLQEITVNGLIPGENLEQGFISTEIPCLDPVNLSLANEYGSLAASSLDVDSPGFSAQDYEPNGRAEVVP